jgi:hypothetical protein
MPMSKYTLIAAKSIPKVTVCVFTIIYNYKESDGQIGLKLNELEEAEVKIDSGRIIEMTPPVESK